MAFENVAIQSTRNGAILVVGYREDILAADVLAFSLTSMVGVSSVRWEIGGRPEFSAAGGAGANPWPLGTSPTASFTVDSDAPPVHRDGTYIVWATINPGAPSETRKSVAVRRLTGLTIPAPGGLTVPLAKLGGFESLEDTSVPNLLAGWATMLNRWLEWARGAGGGGGGTVNQVHAGTGISITGTLADPIVNNTGVILITAGPGISITGTTSLPVVNNTGVLSITAGVNVSLGGTAQNPIINAAGGGGGGAAPTLFRRTNLAGMAGIDASVFLTSDAHLCEVLSVGDFYKYVPGTALTADGITVVTNTGGGGGQWHRLLIENFVWRKQVTWSIDESNVSTVASDENTGIDDAHPLRNSDEFVRRLGSSGLLANTVVRWMSDTVRANLDLAALFPGNLPAATAPVLAFVGLPTVLRSGTLTGGTDAPWTVTDSSLPVTWGALNLLSSLSGTKLIRKTDLSKHAFMGYEDVAKTCHTSPANGFNETVTLSAFGTAGVVFAPGDAYEVLSLPKFPSVTPPGDESGYGGTIFMLLDMGSKVSGGHAHLRHCGFRSTASTLDAMARSGSHQLYGCGFVGAANLQGASSASIADRCMFLGAALLSGYNGNWASTINLIAKAGSLTASLSSRPRLGTLWTIDCTSNPAVQVDNNTIATVDAGHGSGNTGVLWKVRDASCGFTSTFDAGGFDATTSAAHPISVVGNPYDYADLPIFRLSKNAGFTVTS